MFISSFRNCSILSFKVTAINQKSHSALLQSIILRTCTHAYCDIVQSLKHINEMIWNIFHETHAFFKSYTCCTEFVLSWLGWIIQYLIHVKLKPLHPSCSVKSRNCVHWLYRIPTKSANRHDFYHFAMNLFFHVMRLSAISFAICQAYQTWRIWACFMDLRARGFRCCSSWSWDITNFRGRLWIK